MQKLKNEELARLSTSDYKAAKKIPLVVILDNVRSMNNIGSAFRTSDAFLIKRIILTGITACPPHRDIHKTALGATESVPWRYIENTCDCIESLKEQGYITIAIEQAKDSIKLHNFIPETGKKYAVIFGNEVKGVQQQVMDIVDNCIEIPQVGSKHSLNIAVSIGIVLWDFAHKLKIF